MMKKIISLLCFLSLISVESYPQTTIKALTIQGNIINPVTADYIKRGLQTSKKSSATIVSIPIDFFRVFMDKK